MRKNVFLKSRHKEIIDYIKKHGRVGVSALSKHFMISLGTVRRDLKYLDSKDLIERIHGGAVPKEESIGFVKKKNSYLAEKKAIGNLAASLVNEGDTIFLNGGSTTANVLHYLKNKKVRIITNNLGAIHIMGANTPAELIILGGVCRESSYSLVGEIALNNLKSMYSNCTILGANGIHSELGLTSDIEEEASINKQMIKHSTGPVIVLADSSKIGMVSSFLTSPIADISLLITDKKIDKNLVTQLEKSGIRVLLAPVA